MGRREGEPRDAWELFRRRRMPQLNEPIGLGEWERPQQNTIHNSEDRRVGADPEREDHNRREREPWCFQQQTTTVFEIVPETRHCRSKLESSGSPAPRLAHCTRSRFASSLRSVRNVLESSGSLAPRLAHFTLLALRQLAPFRSQSSRNLTKESTEKKCTAGTTRLTRPPAQKLRYLTERRAGTMEELCGWVKGCSDSDGPYRLRAG